MSEKQIFETSELFLSLEGEGRETGMPTVYARFTKCNFTCKGFNNPCNKPTTDHSVIGFDPKAYKSLADMPPITVGCDSQYAWNPEFAHTWTKHTPTELAAALTELCPSKSWVHPVSGLPTILSLTGGEPTLRQKFLGELMFHPLMSKCKHILLETNAAVPIRPSFIADVNKWLDEDEERVWTWACSPKLAASGEKFEEAVRPDIVLAQEGVSRFNRYFKFVCGNNPAHFDEVEQVLLTYRDFGCTIYPNQVEIMPEACTGAQQTAIAQQVADMCMARGYKFCFRLQNSLYENAIGK